MIRAIAIDDEPLGLKVIENFCSKTEGLSLQKSFTGAGEAQKYLRKHPVDLLFLDIQMPAITGIEFYKNLEHSTMVIFTTAHSEYAVEGFNLKAIDYLLKPYTFERFQQAVTKAQEFQRRPVSKEALAEQHLFVRADYSLVKIQISDILYIEGLDDYQKIHLLNRKPVITRMTMKNLVESLPSEQFMRVHRSYIVSLDKIESIRNKTLHIGESSIPVGNSYEQAFFSYYKTS